jgi:hypothetical protein
MLLPSAYRMRCPRAGPTATNIRGAQLRLVDGGIIGARVIDGIGRRGIERRIAGESKIYWLAVIDATDSVDEAIMLVIADKGVSLGSCSNGPAGPNIALRRHRCS